MPDRRRLRREEQDELEKKKKALKKSYQKSYTGIKRVGSKRFSDTQKILIVGAATIAIIAILSITFLIPPTPYCYYTEGDFVYASLDYDTKTITFDHIDAWYRLQPRSTTLSCDIVDYFNTSYDIKEPSNVESDPFEPGKIKYSINELKSVKSWILLLENGTPLDMATWVTLNTMTTTPSSIPKGVITSVKFKLDLVTKVAINSYNVSLQLNTNLVNTTIQFQSITNGSYTLSPLKFYTSGDALPASSHILLDFNLTIYTNLTSPKINLLETGELNLVMMNTVLGSYTTGSAFKESTIHFTGIGLNKEPELVKTKFLNVVVDIPNFNIGLT
ncbi:MAG TPA: hypothetical protein VMV49_03700 [Candidatus Deferrimicrobium sp.]|nr:hypothetical protein [Candidatus Deferrimicrobium sp.]